jgi:hypothetical protein
MDIGKFIDKYTKANSQQVKDGMLDKCVVATYVPYETKVAESKNIIENTCYKMVNGKKVFYVDTPTRYILFIKVIITYYTDLEFDPMNTLLQINLLEQYGLIDLIVSRIGPDYDKFQTVLNMTLDDVMTNERSLVSYLENMAESFSMTLGELADQISALQETKENNDNELIAQD